MPLPIRPTFNRRMNHSALQAPLDSAEAQNDRTPLSQHCGSPLMAMLVIAHHRLLDRDQQCSPTATYFPGLEATPSPIFSFIHANVRVTQLPNWYRQTDSQRHTSRHELSSRAATPCVEHMHGHLYHQWYHERSNAHDDLLHDGRKR